MQLMWEVVTTGPSECGPASKDPPHVSRGEDQNETEVVLESPVVRLWDETPFESGNSSIAELPREAIASPLFSGLLRGMLLGPFSCITGSIMETSAVLTCIN